MLFNIQLKEGIELDEAVGIMTGQVVYKYEEEQENEKIECSNHIHWHD